MSEGFADKLRRLRRDEPEAPAASSPSQAKGVPVWVKHKLRAQERRRAHLATQATEAYGPEPTCPTTEGEPSDLIESEGVYQKVTLRAGDSLHGHYRLDEVDDVEPAVFARLTGDDSLADLDPRRTVYLDTETTGLSGGAGTYVYMVGLGTYLEDGSFEVWQGFLRGPEEEPALLAACAERIAAADAMVSFFGKSFDRHRLEDKMRVCGVKPPFDRPHLDLCHPLRRLTKGAYADGRLNTLEHELCGLERDDDLPGAFAPAAWFDYLAGRPHRLEGVFQHNLDDVLSLATLTAHLGRVEHEERGSGAPLEGCPARRASALASAYLAQGNRVSALEWFDLAIDRAEDAELDWVPLSYARAEERRKGGDTQGAAEDYRDVVAYGEGTITIDALLGWSKMLEHGEKDREGALVCATRAQGLTNELPLGAAKRRFEADLAKRLARLQD